MGRPTKLDKDTLTKICLALEAGASLEAAAAYGRIAYNTLNEWMKRGAAELERVNGDKRRKIKPGEALYTEFHEAVKKAIDFSEASIISEIRVHGRKTWQALAWLAERRWPKRWARPERIEHTGKDGGPVAHEVRTLTPETARDIREKILGVKDDD